MRVLLTEVVSLRRLCPLVLNANSLLNMRGMAFVPLPLRAAEIVATVRCMRVSASAQFRVAVAAFAWAKASLPSAAVVPLPM